MFHYYYKDPDRPVLDVVFDPDLINPGGVWEVHHRYPTSQETLVTSNFTTYDQYRDYFPNISSGWNPQIPLKLKVTFDYSARLEYAEVAYGNKLFKFEAGGEGLLAGFEGSISLSERREPLFDLLGPNADQLNLGGGIGIGLGSGPSRVSAGAEYRRQFDIHKGKFVESDNLTIGVQPFIEASGNTFNNQTNINIGVIDFKRAFGYGFSINAHFTINNFDLELTEHEKKLYDSFTSGHTATRDVQSIIDKYQ